MPIFSLQWHITAKCQQVCRHCYMYNEPTYQGEVDNELSKGDCIRVLDSFRFFCDSMGVGGSINFTGGDPLLRSDLFELVAAARQRDFQIGILGNPFLLSKEKVSELKSAGVSMYQVSIDGLQDTHDDWRKLGSFAATLEAIKNLKDGGIPVLVMMTISKKNMNELLPVMELVGSLGVELFSFARICSVGNSTMLQEAVLAPLEYRQLLVDAESKVEDLKANGVTTVYSHKCHLWTLLEYERGKLILPTNKEIVYFGCSMGIAHMSILADGTVMACRRFPSIVGKVPEQSLRDIFLSKTMDQYRDISRLELCGNCNLLNLCRGCPAVAYGHSGRFTAPDPQCWRR